MDYKNRTRRVLITGCGGELGFSLCGQFSRMPDTVVIGTTRRSQLEKTRNKFKIAGMPMDRIHIEPLDFEVKNIRKRLFQIRQKYGFIDTVINNAGYILVSSIEDCDVKKAQEVMSVNYLVPVQICSHFVKEMKAMGGGTIVNIASACTFVSIPTHGFYAASKAALEAATRALQLEVKDHGINVYCIQPGLIKNKAYEKAVHVNRSHRESYSQVEHILEAFRASLAPKSDYVASKILEVVEFKPRKLAIRVTHDSVLLHFFRKLGSSPFVFSFIYYASLVFGKALGPQSLGEKSVNNVLNLSHYRGNFPEEPTLGNHNI